MLIPACYPGSATRNLRAKSPYEADFPSQTFQSIVSAQPEHAEVRKLPLQIACCLASTSTPPLQVSSSSHPILPFFPFTTTSLQTFHFRLIIPSNEHLSFTNLLVCLDWPNDGHLEALFNVKISFGRNNLRQRGLNYTLLIYINDIVPVLHCFRTTVWHWGCMQHSESQRPCTKSQHVSHSHAVFESFSQRKLPTPLNPFIIGVNATLVCWSLSSLNFPKKTH